MKKAFMAILAFLMCFLCIGCTSNENDNVLLPEAENTEQKDETSDNESPLVTEGEVIVTSLDELKLYTDAGLFDEDFYNYFYGFFVDGWEFPEINNVVFSNLLFTFNLPFDNFNGMDYSFTVVKSDLEGLKPGEYRRHIADGMYDFVVSDPDNPKDYHKYSDVEEAGKLMTFFALNGIWNTPTYGKGTTYPGAYDYIRTVYGDKKDYSKLDYESLCRYAAEEFGITEPEKMYIIGNILSDGGFWAKYDRWPAPEYDIADVKKTADGTEITVQMYADEEHFVLSHKILYYFDKKGHFNGYMILKKGKYVPRGFGYIEDDGTIEVASPNNLAYYAEHGAIDYQHQYETMK